MSQEDRERAALGGQSQPGNEKMTRAAGVNSLFTTLSRIFGLVRDMLMANYFGVGFCSSAFVTAFTLPNLLRRLFGEGALASVFVPQFAHVMEKEGKEEAYKCASITLTWLSLVLSLITLVVCVLALSLVPFLSCSPKWRLTALLAAVMMPYCVFICLTALCGSMLNTLGHFSMPALAPVFLNVCIISMVWLGSFFVESGSQNHIYFAAVGVLLGGLSQLALQIPRLRRYGYRFSFLPLWNHPFVHKLVSIMLPAVLGTGVAQINIMVDRYLANSVNERGAAVLYNADRLVEFPLGIFGVAVAVAALPVLSFAYAKGDLGRYKGSLNFAIRQAAFIMVPAMCGLLILGGPIIRLLLQHGEFTAESTSFTARALFYYTLGLPGFAIVKILVPAFYAANDTKTPVKIGLCMLFANVVLNLALMQFMEERGLALATTICTYANLGLLAFFLQKKLGYLGLDSILMSLGKTVAASLGMTVVILLALNWVDRSLGSHAGFAYELFSVVLPMLAGLASFTLLSLLLGQGELREIASAYLERKQRNKK